MTAPATPPLGGITAQLLRDRREHCNRLFYEARRLKPKLDAPAFSELLSGTLPSAIEAVNAVDSSKTAAVFDTLYELLLDLLGQDLLGPRSRCPQLGPAWCGLLPNLAKHLANDPRKIAGAVTNAVFNLAQTPGARPEAWIDRMAELGCECHSVAELLQAGQIAAWTSGMAHFRTEALAALETIGAHHAELACGLLELPAMPSANVAAVLSAMKDDPWITPQVARKGRVALGQLRVVRRIGAFKGFGGSFMAPPCVVQDQGQFVVGDGHATWILSADVFGATLVKHAAATCSPRRHLAHGAGGNLRLNTGSGNFPELKIILSAADDGRTLAVTVPFSHTISLLAVG